MSAFLFAFIHRVLSGAQNGFGYSKNFFGLIICGGVLFFPLILFKFHWLIILLIIAYVISLFFKTISFTKHFNKLSKYKDIHFWENNVTGIFVIYLILLGYNIFPIICSVYPALILHKGFINLGSGLPFFSEITDDKTGKNYSIPLLGIKVKRSSTIFRIILSIISIIVLIIVLLTESTFTIHLI